MLTVANALTEIRNKINDRDMVGLDDSEILSYLNEAIQLVGGYLAGYSNASAINTLTISTSTGVLPSNFSKLAGIYPVKITGKNIALLDSPPITIRYFATPSSVSTSDNMPFNHDALNIIAIKAAAVYANAQQKLDVSQDQTLKQEILQTIALSIGVGTGEKQ